MATRRLHRVARRATGWVLICLVSLPVELGSYELERVWELGEELDVGLTLPVRAQKASSHELWLLHQTRGTTDFVAVGRQPTSWQECTSTGDDPHLVTDYFISRDGSLAIVYPCQLMVRCGPEFSYFVDFDLERRTPVFGDAVRVSRFTHVLGRSKIASFTETGRTHPMMLPATLTLSVVEAGHRRVERWTDSTFTTLVSCDMNDREDVVAIVADKRPGSPGTKFALLRAPEDSEPSLVELPELHYSATVSLSPRGEWLAIATSRTLPGQDMNKHGGPFERSIEVLVLDANSLEQRGPTVDFTECLQGARFEWLLSFALGDDAAVAIAARTVDRDGVHLVVVSDDDRCGRAILPASSGFRSIDVRVFGGQYVYVADSYEVEKGGPRPQVLRYR